MRDYICEVKWRALTDTGPGSRVCKLRDIGASSHALPVQPIPEGTFILWASLHTRSAELVRI